MIGKFVVAWFLSIAAESITAFIMGYRGKRFFTVIFFVNTITNPALNYIVIVIQIIIHGRIPVFAVLILECLVVISEWQILAYIYPERARALLKLSVIANAVSYAAGLVAFCVIPV